MAANKEVQLAWATWGTNATNLSGVFLYLNIK